jgi:molecular chaperone GrpE
MSEENEIKEAKQSEALSPDASPEAFREEEEDIVEFEYNADGEEDLKKTLKKLRADLKQAKKEKEEYLTGWQKERADFANYKKGEEDRKTMLSESMRERIISRFLAVADSFSMAFANKEAWEKVDLNWRIGIQHIYSQLYSIFEEYGIKEIGAEGESFDHNIHESLEVVSTDKKEQDHKIAKVIQKGYKLGDRVIRPARVNVYEFRD